MAKKSSKTKSYKEKLERIVNNNKKTLVICFVILLIVILLILIVPRYTNNKEHASEGINKISANLNDGIVKEELVNDLKIDNISLIRNKNNKQYIFNANVTNTKSSVNTIKQLDIILKDKDGSVLITLVGDISDDGLKQNETKTITAYISDSIDLSKATSKEIKEHLKK